MTNVKNDELIKIMNNDDFTNCGINKLTNEEQLNLSKWFWREHLYTCDICCPQVASIEKIKYDGKLIVCDNGKKYESSDEYTSSTWYDGDEVLIVDDKMYKLDHLEQVDIEEDID